MVTAIPAKKKKKKKKKDLRYCGRGKDYELFMVEAENKILTQEKDTREDLEKKIFY